MNSDNLKTLITRTLITLKRSFIPMRLLLYCSPALLSYTCSCTTVARDSRSLDSHSHSFTRVYYNHQATYVPNPPRMLENRVRHNSYSARFWTNKPSSSGVVQIGGGDGEPFLFGHHHLLPALSPIRRFLRKVIPIPSYFFHSERVCTSAVPIVLPPLPGSGDSP